jgi:hypothetical protein
MLNKLCIVEQNIRHVTQSKIAMITHLPTELIDDILSYLPHRLLWNGVRQGLPTLRCLAERRFYRQISAYNPDIHSEMFQLSVQLINTESSSSSSSSDALASQSMRLRYGGVNQDGVLQYVPVLTASEHAGFQLSMACSWKDLTGGRIKLQGRFKDEETGAEKTVTMHVPVIREERPQSSVYRCRNSHGTVELLVCCRPQHHYLLDGFDSDECSHEDIVRLSVCWVKISPDMRYY